MAQYRSTPELIDDRYGDRGGWAGVTQIFAAQVPYEFKLANIKDKYRVSRETAQRWHREYKRMRGLV